MGVVICRSTSSGARPAAGVLICTWTGVVSGKASMSRFVQATTPGRPDRVAAKTRKRLRSDQAMTWLSRSMMASSLSVSRNAPAEHSPTRSARALRLTGLKRFRLVVSDDAVLEPLRLEDVAAARDDDLAGPGPTPSPEVAVAQADLHRPRLVFLVGDAHEQQRRGRPTAPPRRARRGRRVAADDDVALEGRVRPQRPGWVGDFRTAWTVCVLSSASGLIQVSRPGGASSAAPSGRTTTSCPPSVARRPPGGPRK